MSIIFVATLTDWGSIAAIVSAVVLTAGIIIRQAKISWDKSHPFTIQVTRHVYDSDFHFKTYTSILKESLPWATKLAELGTKDTVLLIRISPRKETSWDKVNMRFVNREFNPRLNRLFRYTNADKTILQVTGLEDVIYRERQEEWGRPYFESDPDEIAGYSGIYAPALPIKKGEFVYFYVYTTATDEWRGFISFEAALQDQRLLKRMKARVNMPKFINEKGKEKRLTRNQFHELLKKASQPVKKSEKEES